jgi:hypothetical protein
MEPSTASTRAFSCNYPEAVESTARHRDQFLTLDIRGMNDIRLISKPIHAPSHELEDTDTNIPPTKVINKRIFVELLSIREESVIIYLWGMNQLAYFSLLFYVEVYCLHLGV